MTPARNFIPDQPDPAQNFSPDFSKKNLKIFPEKIPWPVSQKKVLKNPITTP
jgi:hypothetical protein